MDNKVCAITATCGRHTCIERTVAFFLDQDYAGQHLLLIYNNSPIEQRLSLPEHTVNKKVLLYNSCKDLVTGNNYTNLGDIYRDALSLVPPEYDVITFMDDDDIFLPNHISCGVNGLSEKWTAYKPEKSYYRDNSGIHLMNNTLEPSMFVRREHLDKYGFSQTTTEQHLQWVNPLVEQGLIVADPDGTPTLIYNWGDTFPTFKTSGDYRNPENFNNYRHHSNDHGDQIITPSSVEDFYKLPELCIEK